MAQTTMSSWRWVDILLATKERYIIIKTKENSGFSFLLLDFQLISQSLN